MKVLNLFVILFIKEFLVSGATSSWPRSPLVLHTGKTDEPASRFNGSDRIGHHLPKTLGMAKSKT